MLGFLRGLNEGIAREGQAQRQHQGRLLASKENHLDRLLSQIRYNREMKYRQDRATRQDFISDRSYNRGVLESDRNYQLNANADQRAEETHDVNLSYAKEANPLRLKGMEQNIELGDINIARGWQAYDQSEKVWDAKSPFLSKLAQLEHDQAGANVDLTKARTHALRNPPARSSGSNLKLPTLSDFEKMGANSVFPQMFADQGKTYWLFGNRRLPYDAPTGEQSQKTYLRQGGTDLGRRLREVLPVGQMTDDQLKTYINSYWQGMLNNEEHGPAFRGDLMYGVDPTRGTTRMTDAYRQFSQSAISGFRSPPAAKTIDSPGMGGDTEIDPGMINSPVRPSLTEADPNYVDYLKNTYTPEGQPAEATGTGLDEILKGFGKAWTSGSGRKGAAYQQYFSGEPEPTPSIKPTRPSARVLPSAQYDEAIEMWQATGEMDWFWFDNLPEDVQIRMYNSLPDYQKNKFIESHDQSIMALPR